MHRADPHADRPSRHRGHRQSPHGGGPAFTLLQPPQDPPPSTLTPCHAQVGIRAIPRPAPRRYRIHPLDVIPVVLGIAVLLAIFWPH